MGLLLSQQAGTGPSLANVLPEYGNTMSPHADVASKYSMKTMVRDACTADFSIPKPPVGSGTRSTGGEGWP